MRFHLTGLLVFLNSMLVAGPGARAQYSFVPLQEPGEASSIPLSIWQGRILGLSYDTPGRGSGHQFVYDGFSFVQVNPPAGLPGKGSIVGLNGGVQLGAYTDATFRSHGYLYDGSATTILDAPVAPGWFGSGTHPAAISAGTVVGYYESGTITGHFHGFIYGGGHYSTIDVPGASDTIPTALDGNEVAGDCYQTGPFGGPHSGFIYDGGRFKIINDPLAEGWTHIAGIFGDTVVGYYNVYVGPLSVESHGFVYDGTSFITVDGPTGDVLSSELTGIWGNTIVGDYTDHNGVIHGFIATPSVPEPVGVLAIACVSIFLCRKRKAI